MKAISRLRQSLKGSRGRYFDTETDKGRFHIELFVSLATLLMTPLLTVYIVAQREHTFIDSQRRQTREQTLLDEKIKVQSKISSLVTSASTTRIQLAIQERYMTYIMIKSYDPNVKDDQRISIGTFSDQFAQSHAKMIGE